MSSLTETKDSTQILLRILFHFRRCHPLGNDLKLRVWRVKLSTANDPSSAIVIRETIPINNAGVVRFVKSTSQLPNISFLLTHRIDRRLNEKKLSKIMKNREKVDQLRRILLIIAVLAVTSVGDSASDARYSTHGRIGDVVRRHLLNNVIEIFLFFRNVRFT